MNTRSRRRTAQKLAELQPYLQDGGSLLVVMQNYPDPDALASAAALRELVRVRAGMSTTVASSGQVGRAENRALARYLRLAHRDLAEIDFERFTIYAMVDTQPGTGNNAASCEVLPRLVIDHHPLRQTTREVAIHDVRRSYGATSTILYEYLQVAEVTIDLQLATGLVYGIRSDTQDLGREASQADIEAMNKLYPSSNHRMLSEIQNSKTPRGYFSMLSKALARAQVYGPAVVTSMGPIDIPDIVGEVADLLLRDEEANWALCFGTYKDAVLLSLRTSDRKADAGKVMRRIVDGWGRGGGHRAMAGGQFPLTAVGGRDWEQVEQEVVRRYLRGLGNRKRTPKPLISDGDLGSARRP